MANLIPISQHSPQESCNPALKSQTPPDTYSIFPLTPPASSERRQTRQTTPVENVVQVFEKLRNHTALDPHGSEEIRICLPPDQYLELLKALESDQTLDNYAKCKARYASEDPSPMIH